MFILQVQLDKEELKRLITEAKERLQYVWIAFEQE